MGGPQKAGEVALLTDSAYEGDETRELGPATGLCARGATQSQAQAALDSGQRAFYRRRNEVERLFRRLKAWRRVFTRYDKNDVMFAAFITVALIAEILRLR